MKKLSEVCRIVGITRRTLQEYDKIGLVKPTAKTGAGYWLYDDDAIQRLIIINIFVEAGYKRKRIKSIIQIADKPGRIFFLGFHLKKTIKKQSGTF